MAKKVNMRRKKRKWGRTIGILSVVTIMIVIVTLSELYQSEPQSTPKETADEYFRFSDAQALITAETPDNKSITVSEVYFNITAVGGNANSVLVSPTQGYIPTGRYPYFDEILQNQTKPIDVLYNYSAVFSTKKGDKGYPVYFYVECEEATRAFITIYITAAWWSLY
jgi:hypothetical protein